MRREENVRARGRNDERGAALITALLVSLLLLAAGGALIYSTGMSATSAVDTTAEAQAYYAAEAGLQSALSVLRGNVVKQAGLKLNVKVKNDLRIANQLTTSNVEGDKATVARLSGWLPYQSKEANSRVLLDDTGRLAFSLKLEDPNDLDRSKLANAAYVPASLLITATGYGPKGSIKQMQLLYKRSAFDFDPPSTLLMAGNVSSFSIGSSRKKGYSGLDAADPSATPLPTFGFTESASQTTVNANTFDCGHNSCKKASDSTGDPQTANITGAKLPDWLETPQQAAAFLNDLEAQARGAGRYFATKDGTAAPDIGTPANPDTGLGGVPKFTFIDGDYSGKGGAGLLVVTGNLSFKGNADFDGIVLVLGSYKDDDDNIVGGSFDRSGGGNGTLAGAFVVAKFDRGKPDKFLDVSFDTSGGGNSDVVYDSDKVSDALGSLGGRLLGIVEN